MLSLRGNHYPFQKHHSKYAEHTPNQFHRTLSICGTNFIAGWAYVEWISSLAEHTRKCLKVKYLSRIKYDFKKSRVTGRWDHKVLVSAKKVKKKCHACVPLSFWSTRLESRKCFLLPHLSTFQQTIPTEEYQITYKKINVIIFANLKPSQRI